MIIAESGVGDASAMEEAMRSVGTVSDEAHINDIRSAPVGSGALADTFRLALTWKEADSGPSSVIVKQPARDSTASTTAASLGAYEREIRFYTELAPRTAVRIPRLLGVAGRGAEGLANTLVLEDLSENHRPGDQLGETSHRDVRRARTQLALLQAPFWSDPATRELDWLHRRIGVPIPGIVGRMNESWDFARRDFAAGFPLQQRLCIDRFVSDAEIWAANPFGPCSLVHHDFRVDNVLFSDSDVVVIDWQTIGWGPAMFDVAYLLGTSMEPESRRAVERDEVSAHLRELSGLGIS
ncbi:MAG: aminoglycoside phosphotransferase family protein, partial [Gordonia polyisoprenivorans]|nr:aminoglycoside phosphotransferase family protein [Gordonia polyisoprenivorans]